MISLMKHEYIGALEYISANVQDMGFTKGELDRIHNIALRIVNKTSKSIDK
jgi:hypothetical protein